MTEPSADAFLGGLSRETTLRRDARGRWTHDGEPIENEKIVRAFDAWVDVAPDGRPCLRNAVHWVYVTLEGPHVLVRGARVADGQVLLSLPGGDEEPLDPATLRVGPEGALYCDVRGGRLVARLENSAALALEAVLAEDADGPYLALGVLRVRPPRVRDPLARAPFGS